MKLTTTILILFVCFGCIVKKKSDKAALQPLFYDSAITTTGTLTINYDDYAKDTPVTGYLSSEDFKRFVSKQKAYTDETIDKYDTQKVIMLVCDTSHAYIDLIGMDYKIIYKELNTRKSYWQYGYIIGDNYLDADKKPLSKSIIVWQTKELK